MVFDTRQNGTTAASRSRGSTQLVNDTLIHALEALEEDDINVQLQPINRAAATSTHSAARERQAPR